KGEDALELRVGAHAMEFSLRAREARRRAASSVLHPGGEGPRVSANRLSANRLAALANRTDLSLHLLFVLRPEDHLVAEHEGGRAAQIEDLAQAVRIDQRRLDDIAFRILVEAAHVEPRVLGHLKRLRLRHDAGS